MKLGIEKSLNFSGKNHDNYSQNCCLNCYINYCYELFGSASNGIFGNANFNLETLKNNLLGTDTAGLSDFSLSITGNAQAFLVLSLMTPSVWGRGML